MARWFWVTVGVIAMSLWPGNGRAQERPPYTPPVGVVAETILACVGSNEGFIVPAGETRVVIASTRGPTDIYYLTPHFLDMSLPSQHDGYPNPDYPLDEAFEQKMTDCFDQTVGALGQRSPFSP